MSRKESHKKEMEAFRLAQRLKQAENAAATAGGGVKNTVTASNVSIYDIVPGIRGSTAFSVENSILSEKQKAQEYSGYARTFSQKALNEELMENYPDSRFLWQQAAKMDEISRAAREKAAFYQTVVQNPSAAFAGPGTAPKPVQTAQRDPPTAETADTVSLPHPTQRETSASPAAEYLQKSLRQIALGNFTDDVTLAGTAGQIGLGFTGLDFPLDLRDLAADVVNYETTPKWQILVDAAALLPFVGSLKYVDEAAALAKHGDEAMDAAKSLRRTATAADAVADTAKQADNLMDTGGELVYNGVKQTGKIDLMPADLMDELSASGVKYTPEDVLMVTKNSNGDLLWLEKGNPNNGWQHILEKHGNHFQHDDDSAYSPEEIQSFMKELLDSEPIAQGVNNNGPYAIYAYNGKNYRIVWGDNGYIKSFFPDKRKY